MFECHCSPCFTKIPIPPHNIRQSLIARGAIFGNECFNYPLIEVQFPGGWSYIKILVLSEFNDYWYIFDHTKRLVLRYAVSISNVEKVIFNTKRNKLPFTYPIPEWYTVIDHELVFDETTPIGNFLILLDECYNAYSKYIYEYNKLLPLDKKLSGDDPDYIDHLRDYYEQIIECKKKVKHNYNPSGKNPILEFRCYGRYLSDKLPPLTPDEILSYCTTKQKQKRYHTFFKNGHFKATAELYKERAQHEFDSLDKYDDDYIEKYNALITLNREVFLNHELIPEPVRKKEDCIIL